MNLLALDLYHNLKNLSLKEVDTYIRAHSDIDDNAWSVMELTWLDGSHRIFFEYPTDFTEEEADLFLRGL